MSDSLCWKCREKIDNDYEDDPKREERTENYLLNNPFLHCHHQPKEKEKCWCELDGSTKAYAQKITGNQWELIDNFCPQCGKKL